MPDKEWACGRRNLMQNMRKAYIIVIDMQRKESFIL